MAAGRFLLTVLLATLATASCGGGNASTPPLKPSPSLTTPMQASLRDLKMVSDRTGWALADLSSSTHVVRTTDGGLHWKTVLARGSGSVPDDYVPSVPDFHSAMQAWVLGYLGAHSTSSNQADAIAFTSDGGQHWSTVSDFRVDGQATHLQFLDLQHGWVFATPSAGGAIGSQDMTLLRTVDGGGSWAVIKPASQVRADPAVHGTLPEPCGFGVLDAPSFANAQDGWVAAACDSRPVLYASHDGGLTWSPHSLPGFPASAGEPNPPRYVTRSPRFISAEDGYLIVLRGATTGAGHLQEAAIYVTRDAGLTWTPYRLPQGELHTDFVDSQDGWFVGISEVGGALTPVLYATHDGGLTWRQIAGPQDYFDGDLSFVSPTVGFIAMQSIKAQPGQFLMTSDGGLTWTRVETVIS